MSRAFLCIALVTCLAGTALADEKKAPTPEQELEEMLRQGNARAKDDLEAGVDFLAFAYVKHQDGQVRVVTAPEVKETGGGLEGSARVPSRALDGLVKKLRSEQSGGGGFRAVAIFSDDEVRIEGKDTSAVEAGLEHESGYCVNVFTPYSRLVQAEVVYGEAVSSKRPRGQVLRCK